MAKPGDRCERCGDELDVVEVTRFGDREPSWLLGRPCPCPGPRCPSCARRLVDDRCPALIDCPVGGALVPVPDFA